MPNISRTICHLVCRSAHGFVGLMTTRTQRYRLLTSVLSVWSVPCGDKFATWILISVPCTRPETSLDGRVLHQTSCSVKSAKLRTHLRAFWTVQIVKFALEDNASREEWPIGRISDHGITVFDDIETYGGSLPVRATSVTFGSCRHTTTDDWLRIRRKING